MEPLYLDNNATTPLLPAVWDAMRPYFLHAFGNPASAHAVGRKARRALEDAREQVGVLLDAHPDEVLFTSGATESNNLALFGLCGDPPAGLIAGLIEHPSVTEPLAQLAAAGFSLHLLPVAPTGAVEPATLAGTLAPDTRLLAVMLANHETGAVQPIEALAGQIPDNVAFHCDAVQAVGKIPVRFHALGVTSLSLSAHKFHGPRGIGALLLRRGSRLRPRNWGGHQQRGLRPGTEPVALVVGLAAALDLAIRELEARTAHVVALRRALLTALRERAAPVVLNGPEQGGIPHTLNLSFPGIKADLLLMRLDLAGVACSAGSACSSGSLLPSPVLRAMGVPEAVLTSAVRFSLSPLLSADEVEEAARRIIRIVNDLRRSTPHPD
jgi:cysteine desulfurase